LREFATPKTAADLRELLAESIIEIRAGKLDPRIANALGYLGASYLRALEVSEIESRLDALEAHQRDPTVEPETGGWVDGQEINSGTIGEIED
jgi:hypothetical protein